MRKFAGFEKGVNLGGWLSQCDYSDERLDNFITENDFKTVKSWGVDHVRIPVDYNIFQDENGKTTERGFRYLDWAFEWAEKCNLGVILDLHKTAGFFFDKAQKEAGFFESEKLQERFYDLWREFTERYGKTGDDVVFELLNEVTDPSYIDAWNEIASKAIGIIRSKSKDKRIVVGSYWNNSIDALKDIDIPIDDGIVYTFHCYDPLLFTHQGAYWVDNMPSDFRIDYPGDFKEYNNAKDKFQFDFLPYYTGEKGSFSSEFFEGRFEVAVKVAEEKNVPLYCGEYGTIKLADKTSLINWYKDINAAFRKAGIARAAWSYKEVDYGLCDKELVGVIDEIIKYL